MMLAYIGALSAENLWLTYAGLCFYSIQAIYITVSKVSFHSTNIYSWIHRCVKNEINFLLQTLIQLCTSL